MAEDVVNSGAFVISGSDPEPNGVAAPGETGKLSDAGHVHEQDVGVFDPGDAVADIGVTTTLAAVPAEFADLAAVQTYLEDLVGDVEDRLDDIEAKVDELLDILRDATVIAT